MWYEVYKTIKFCRCTIPSSTTNSVSNQRNGESIGKTMPLSIVKVSYHAIQAKYVDPKLQIPTLEDRN